MQPSRLLLAATLALAPLAPAGAQEPLDDVEMAHAAVTASEIDIAYAHLALALSDDEAVRAFAQTMIRDHSAVNDRVAALAEKLDVQPRDNAMSRRLREDATRTTDELSRLRGADFDRAYARNELAYHRAVNTAVADTFIPGARNPEVAAAFREALTIFRGHERHAERMVESLADEGR